MLLDFVLLCQEQQIPFLTEGHHHCHEGWVQIHCPFCAGGEEGWHLGYGFEKGNFNCWRCGGHSMYKVLRAICRIPTYQLIAKYRTEGVVLPGRKKVVRKAEAKPPSRLESLCKAHIQYLKKRLYSRERLKVWDLKGTRGLSKDWSWRVVAPIRDRTSRIVAYTGRTIGKDVNPRWKVSRDEDCVVDPRSLIYGIDLIEDKVLVVEGPSDVWRMGPGAVGLLGIDWTIQQANILKDIPERYILFDPEPKAQVQAEKLANYLAPFPGRTEILSGFQTDPGGLKQSQADSIMQELGFL